MKIRNICTLTLLANLLSNGAWAGVADYVYVPAVEYGEKEIDFKTGTAKLQNGDRAQVSSIGFGYGVTEYWFTEVYFKHEREGSDTLSIGEWENKFQLTETGQYPVDVGLITELDAPLSGNAPWELKLGPLFQTEFGKVQLNTNLLFERAFGKADEDGAPHTTEFSYQWQIKYRWQPAFEYGLQGMGELGKWNDWNKQLDQIHQAGPAVFGKIALGNRQAIKYNAAWLFGTSQAAPNNTFRIQVEYEY
jgi:hypothetical protein